MNYFGYIPAHKGKKAFLKLYFTQVREVTARLEHGVDTKTKIRHYCLMYLATARNKSDSQSSKLKMLHPHLNK